MSTTMTAAAPSLSETRAKPRPAGEIIGAALKQLGVERAYGVMGGGVARLISGLESGGVELVHMRHESGAAFAACEEYHVRGRPAVVWTTTGPGFVNALNGLTAVGWEGAKTLLFAGATAREVPPGLGFQDTRDRHLTALRSLAAPHVDLSISYPRTSADLYRLLDDWRVALEQPGAFIGTAMLPLELQQACIEPWVPREVQHARRHCGPRKDVYQRLAAELQAGTTLVWAGFGARGAARHLRELVARTGARVISSPRAKGIFPETDPAYLGVSGHGGHDKVQAFLESPGVDTLLILGTRLHELTSFWDARFSPRKTVVHVDRDPAALVNDFLDVPQMAVQADIESFLTDLLEHLPAAPKSARPQQNGPLTEYYPAGSGAGIHPAELMAVVQREIVECCDIPVMAEGGMAWAWGPHCLRFDTPRFRVSTTWGSMGHFSAGVVGAALAAGRPALCLVGDGSILMQSEVSTAVAHKADAKWLVINDGGYGTIRHGLASIKLPPMAIDIPRVRFDLWAEAQGAKGLRASTPAELAQALQQAMAIPGPVVIDAEVDRAVAPPIGRRNVSLGSGEESWRT